MVTKENLKRILSDYYPTVPVKPLEKISNEIYEEIEKERVELYDSIYIYLDNKVNFLEMKLNSTKNQKSVAKKELKVAETIKDTIDKMFLKNFK